MLMETLAEQLPQGTIRFNSRVVGIKMPENASGPSVVELHDGSTYSAKVCQMYTQLQLLPEAGCSTFRSAWAHLCLYSISTSSF